MSQNDDDTIDRDADDVERAEAEALARALDAQGDPVPGSDAATVAALRASRDPAGLDPEAKRRMVSRAVASARSARRRRWIRPAGLAFAAAAAIVLVVASRSGGPTPAAPRSYGGASDAVFGAPFPDDEPASARLDRLTSARTRDYFASIAEGDER